MKTFFTRNNTKAARTVTTDRGAQINESGAQTPHMSNGISDRPHILQARAARHRRRETH